VSAQSVILKCTIATPLRGDGVVKAFLQVDPAAALNGDHMITSLHRSVVEIDSGKTYWVTFKEIEQPSE
jgi:hypothetical protein